MALESVVTEIPNTEKMGLTSLPSLIYNDVTMPWTSRSLSLNAFVLLHKTAYTSKSESVPFASVVVVVLHQKVYTDLKHYYDVLKCPALGPLPCGL